jgi:signal transduction histidine kinase
VERFSEQTGVKVDLRLEEPSRKLPPEIEISAYRIVQEALTNIARHAGIGRAQVHIWEAHGMLKISIEDSGVGFDADATAKSVTSSGLMGMQERAKLVGGVINIESQLSQGTRIHAELPVQSITTEFTA